MESLLRSACRLDDPGLEGRAAALDDPGARRRFLSAAGAHGVLGTVLVELEERGLLETLSAGARRDLEDQLSRLRLRARAWLEERARLLAALSDRGIRPVVLKGAALCSTVYREPAERPFTDVDLLLEREETAAAVEALAGTGYEPRGGRRGVDAYRAHHFHVRLEHPRGFVAELHWDFTRPGSPFRVDPDHVRARAGIHESAGAEFRVPAPEDHLLQMAVQQVHEAFRGLRRLVDVDRIVRAAPSVDARYLREAAGSGRLRTATALSLGLARRVLGSPLAGDLAGEAGGAPPVARAHLSLLRPPGAVLSGHRGAPSPAESRLVRLWLHDRVRDRLAYLLDVGAGRADPVRWLWSDATPATRGRRTLRGGMALARLAAAELRLAPALLRRAVAGPGD